MKRALILSIGLLMVLAVATAASAQTQATPKPQRPAGTTVGPNFVDVNGDGICDNFQSGTRGGRAMKAGRGGFGPGDGTGNQESPEGRHRLGLAWLPAPASATAPVRRARACAGAAQRGAASKR
jgi:hypothetical protein